MILVTGGSGLLGSYLVPLLRYKGLQVANPSHHQFDIIDGLISCKPSVVVHCAAQTGTNSLGREEDYYKTNVIGTHNLVRQSGRSHFVYISTDYVFDGLRGNYSPIETPSPFNYYALTKLIGEEIVKTLSSYTIIRTSFKSVPWEVAQAPVDTITSADFVDIIAPKICEVILKCPQGIVHIGTEPKTLFDLARRRNPKVRPCHRGDIPNVRLPENITLGGLFE